MLCDSVDQIIKMMVLMMMIMMLIKMTPIKTMLKKMISGIRASGYFPSWSPSHWRGSRTWCDLVHVCNISHFESFVFGFYYA